MTDTGSTKRPSADAAGELSVRFSRPDDAADICVLFRKVFGEDMSDGRWYWKYGRAQSRAVVVYKGDSLVGHYGGIGADILLDGEQSTAIQITDLMVDPEARHAVRSRSPFNLSAEKFLKNFVGYGNPFLLGYGFPSDRAMGLSEKLGFFAPVGRMWEIRWRTGNGKTPFSERLVTLDKKNFALYEKKIDRLWESFSKHFVRHIICRKDAAYFRWRFLDCPDNKYSLSLVFGRFSGKPKALIAMKHDENRSMLMDYIGLSLDPGTVVRHGQVMTAKKGRYFMLTWCSDAFLELFSLYGARQEALDIAIPACTGSPGPAPETQKNKWWFMPGDTDYL